MINPYILSIETTEGNSYKHGFHLGTILDVAKAIAEEQFNARVANRQPIVTVALMRNGKIIDVFYGNGLWHSEMD